MLSTALGYGGQNVSDYLPLILAVLLIVTILQSPDGVAALVSGQLQAVGRILGRARRSTPRPVNHAGVVPLAEGHRVRSATLTTHDLAVRFGGVTALKSLSMTVSSGQVVGIIGPNGAGKTTFIDALTGFVRVSGGGATLDGRDVTGASPAALARRGVTRSFQSLELFSDMTVLENLRVASEPRDSLAYIKDLVVTDYAAVDSGGPGGDHRVRLGGRARPQAVRAVLRATSPCRHRPGGGNRAEHPLSGRARGRP